MTAPLNPTLPFHDDETPAGYVSRLAARHHTPARFFCTDMGLRLQAIADGDSDALDKLATLSGADPARLARNALLRGDDGFQLRGERMMKQTLRRTHVRACPLCFAEDIAAAPTLPPAIAVHQRLAWMVEHIKTCVRHEAALVDLASAANTEMYDFVALATRADDLQNLPVVRRPASGLEAYLTARLDSAKDHNALLDGLEFGVVAKTCEILGAVALHGRDADLKSMTDNDWRAAGGAGFAIAAGGEEKIRAFLADMQASYPYSRAATEGPQATFGQLFKWAAFSAKDSAFDPVRDLLRRHIIETTPVGPGDTILGQPVETRRWHSVYTAAQAFGAHPKRLRKILAAKGLLSEGHETKADNHVLVDAGAAQELYDSGAVDGLSLKELETYTGAGRVQAKLLADSGILPPVIGRGDISDASGALAFARKDVDAFLARLQDGAEPVEVAGAGQYDIPSAAKRANCSAMEIVRLILDKQLDWTGRLTTRDKYMAILVDLKEIKAKTHNLPPLDGLTAEQVQKTLHYSWPVVRALIDHKILATEDRINPVNRCPVKIIKTDEIDRFRKTYVSLTDLAEERGLHPTLVKRFLDEDGVRPALGKAIYHAAFYRRSQL